MNNYFEFNDTRDFSQIPAQMHLDYASLNAAFCKALKSEDGRIFRINPTTGHPEFGAYCESNSNELVTWGILAIGEWLLMHDTDWIAPTYPDFFSDLYHVFFNSPGISRVEHWYLFYVNMLAGAVSRTLYKGDSQTIKRIREAAYTMRSVAHKLNYDFNSQGFEFNQDAAFTRKDIYRQPDSIGGFAYNMLFAYGFLKEKMFLQESCKGIDKYLSFEDNPWYEIPNGSSAVYAAAWLNAHGHTCNVEKAAGWLFDHKTGPMQRGFWGGECVNGLFMGWRGDTRQDALDSAYSMESLMPLQFALPAVRYCPALAETVSNWTRHLLSSFGLFYGQGKRKLPETRPDLPSAIPYERLIRNGDELPKACGDFFGHRSVYGAGYLMWMESMIRFTEDKWIFAMDLSITDWVNDEVVPVFAVQNPYSEKKEITFTIAQAWKRKAPKLFHKKLFVYEIEKNLHNCNKISEYCGIINLTLEPGEIKFVALSDAVPNNINGMIVAENGAEILFTQERK